MEGDPLMERFIRPWWLITGAGGLLVASLLLRPTTTPGVLAVLALALVVLSYWPRVARS